METWQKYELWATSCALHAGKSSCMFQHDIPYTGLHKKINCLPFLSVNGLLSGLLCNWHRIPCVLLWRPSGLAVEEFVALVWLCNPMLVFEDLFAVFVKLFGAPSVLHNETTWTREYGCVPIKFYWMQHRILINVNIQNRTITDASSLVLSFLRRPNIGNSTPLVLDEDEINQYYLQLVGPVFSLQRPVVKRDFPIDIPHLATMNFIDRIRSLVLYLLRSVQLIR